MRRFYKIHNWIRLLLFGIFPGIFLLCGNILFIVWLSKYNESFYRYSKRTIKESILKKELTTSQPILNSQPSTKNRLSALTDTVPRRSTIATVSSGEVLIQIKMFRVSHANEGIQSNETKSKRILTVDLSNLKICDVCYKDLTEDADDSSTCLLCSNVRRKSLPCELSETGKETVSKEMLTGGLTDRRTSSQQTLTSENDPTRKISKRKQVVWSRPSMLIDHKIRQRERVSFTISEHIITTKI